MKSTLAKKRKNMLLAFAGMLLLDLLVLTLVDFGITGQTALIAKQSVTESNR